MQCSSSLERLAVERRSRDRVFWSRTQLHGRIKWFNKSKGYGFIGRENEPDVFIHYSGIVGDGYRTLQEGDRVYFEIVQKANGPQAVNVVKIPSAK